MKHKQDFITFIFQNIGIYFLYAIGMLYAFGIFILNSVDITFSFLSFIILITSIKITLTCYSIYSTEIINLLKEKPIFLIPILLFDFFLISLFEKLDFGALGIVLSVMPCILIYYIFYKLKGIINFSKIRYFVLFFIKLFLFILGLLSIIVFLGLFVNPENINIALSLLLFFFIIIFVSIFENLFLYILCSNLKLLSEKLYVIKKKLCISIIGDVLVYFIITCYILNNFNSFFTMYE